MRTPLTHQILRTSKTTRLNKLPQPGKYIVWWYGGVYKNAKDTYQPQVMVTYRKLIDSQHVSNRVVNSAITLTALGQLRIGSVWSGGVSLGEIDFDSEIFTIDFSAPGWKLTTLQEIYVQNEISAFPYDLYPPPSLQDPSWLIEFSLSNGGKLIVPCLEFFTRCYGRSSEVRRCLATFPWDRLQNERLYAPIDEPEESGKWKIKLRPRLVNGDAVLLAHAKYDKYTQNAVKEIYAQTETGYGTDGTQATYLKIKPWFQGLAKLKVKGIWFDEGKSFLALQVIGGSDPGGIPIWQNRESLSSSANAAEGAELEFSWPGAPSRKLIKSPDIINLTDALAPDPNAMAVEIEDPDFEILGTPRVVHQLYRPVPQAHSEAKIEGSDTSAFSSGDPHGHGQGIGRAAIHATPVLESHGILRDMWNAMLFLKDLYPETIQSVEWFTFEDGYCTNKVPKLIGIEPFEERGKELDSSTWKWPFMDPKTMQELRGILVIRIIGNGKHIYILEVQRRFGSIRDKKRNPEGAEEQHRGLVFCLYNQSDFNSWLTQLLSDIRYVKGVFSKLAHLCPGKAEPFSHRSSRNEHTPCEAASRNALEKMGIKLYKNPVL